MSQNHGVGRRTFLKNAGLTAFAGAVATSHPSALSAALPPGNKYDFDTVYDRFNTDCTKFDQQIARYGKGSVQVGMGIADMDFRAAPVITRAIQERLKHENWGYLDMTGAYVQAYRQGIIDWNKRRYGVDIDPANLVLTAGVHPAIVATLKTFSPRGSKVLLQTPTYNGFYSDLRDSGTRAEESPLKEVNGVFSMDFDDLERRISHETNTLLLCNPQNPTGNCWSPADLMRVGEICLRRRVIVLADEIHCDWVTKGQKYTPFSSLPDKAIVNNSITFKAASKSFGLAAMKHAWMFSDNAELINRVRANHQADLNTLGFAANKAAYTPEGEEWLNQCVAYIDGNHDFVKAYVDTHIPMIKVMKPQGTYLSWLDVTAVADKIDAKRQAEEANRTKAHGAADITPETVVERFFVKHAKVHLNQGASYGLGGANHMRMNIATSRKLIELALSNIAGALRKT